MPSENGTPISLTHSQTFQILDEMGGKIFGKRQQAIALGLDNFTFEFPLPDWLTDADDVFLRVTSRGDACNISFHLGVADPALKEIEPVIHKGALH